MNLASILLRAARLHGKRSAVSCRGRSFTYEEFLDHTSRLAASLREEGIGPGTALGMLHRNCHHFLEAYFAAASLGAGRVAPCGAMFHLADAWATWAGDHRVH